MERVAARSALNLFATPTFHRKAPATNSPLARWKSRIMALSGHNVLNLEIKKPYLYAAWEILPFTHIAEDEISTVIAHERLLGE